MKKIYLLFLFVAMAGMGFGQTALPVSRTVWNSTPSDWIDHGTGSYTSSFACSGNNSGKLDGTGDYYQVYFDSSPDELVFKLKKASMSGESMLVVEESSNASSWTTIGTYGTCGSCTSINDCGDITISLNSTSRYVKWSYTKSSGNCVIDDVSITAAASGPEDPTAFTATTATPTQIDLSWTENGDNDDVLIAWNSTNTFGTPVDGTAYASGSAIPDGGTSLGTDSDGAYSHTSLDNGTQYYYKIWSVDGSTNYSSGVTDNATTYKNEPTNHVTGFTATTNGSGEINLSWTDATGTTLPDNYLIKASTADNVSAPVDGTEVADNTTIGDDSGAKNVAHTGGSNSYAWSGLTASTTYYFKIYPYTNSGTAIDYKTDGTVPNDDATTNAAPVAPTAGVVFISEVSDGSTTSSEYLELYNSSNDEIDLSASKIIMLTDGTVFDISDYTGETTIPANGLFIIARNSTKANFESDWGISLSSSCKFNEGSGSMYFGTGTARRWVLKDGGTYNTDDGTLIDDTDGTVAGSGNRSYQYPTDTWVTESYSGNSTPGTIPEVENSATFLWDDGASSSNWSDADNWNPNQEPTSNINIIIPSGNTVVIDNSIAAYAKCNNLEIESGASLTIPVGKALTVNGTLTNGAATAGDGLLIESTSSGSGSLLHTGGFPTATVERFVTNGEWNMVAPPIGSTTTQTFADASVSDSWLTRLDEPTATNNSGAGTGWVYITDLATALSHGSGYSYWPSVDETISFKGDVRSSDLGVPNGNTTFTYTDGTHGYNLIGNPFPSALEWNSNADWLLSNVESTIWIYDGSAYQSYTTAAGHDIPVGQGFIMRANAASPSLILPSSQRKHSSQAFLKNGRNGGIGEYENALIIVANNNQIQDKVQISFQENGTEGFDNGWDGTKLFGSQEAPQLFLVEGELQQSYDHFPNLEEGDERTVAMSYIPGAEGDQELVADFTCFSGADVILEDLKTGITQDLKEENTYSFTGSKEDSPERFLIHFAYSPDGIGEEFDNSSSINIYSYGNNIYIRSSEEAINQSGEVFVYDLMGRKLLQKQIGTGQLHKMTVNTNNNYVIVKVVKQGFVQTEKVFIK